MENVQESSESGQALFEFIIFLPFMLIVYSISLTITNAINGSINQQKVTRGYYFNLIHNDSNLQTNATLLDYRKTSLQRVGLFAIGWRWYAESDTQVAPCYKILSVSKTTETEKCQDKGGSTPVSTQYIRVKTVFGVCSATYFFLNNTYVLASNVPGVSSADYASCLNI